MTTDDCRLCYAQERSKSSDSERSSRPESSRRLTIDDLAGRTSVTTRTIRRDSRPSRRPGSLFSTKSTRASATGRSSNVPSAGSTRRAQPRRVERALLHANACRMSRGDAVPTGRSQRVRQAGGGAHARHAQFLDRLPSRFRPRPIRASPKARRPDDGRVRSLIRAWHNCSTPRSTIV